MSNPVPSSLALTTPADLSTLIASRDRNNDTAIQTAVNAIITALSGGVAGQLLRAASSSAVDWNGGVYADYAPAWTSSGVAPVLNNGTLTSRYVQMGKLVHYFGQLVMGTTTTFGTGNYSISLPVTRSSAGTGASGRCHGLVEGFDFSSANDLLAVGDTAGSATSFQMFYMGTWLGTRLPISATTPWTWASGDFIVWNLTYEAA